MRFRIIDISVFVKQIFHCSTVLLVNSFDFQLACVVWQCVCVRFGSKNRDQESDLHLGSRNMQNISDERIHLIILTLCTTFPFFDGNRSANNNAEGGEKWELRWRRGRKERALIGRR